MSDEQTVLDELVQKFPGLSGKITIARPRRVFVETPAESLPEVFEHLVREMDFSILCAITGLDQGATLGVMYHLARQNGTVLTLLAAVPKEAPILQSVTDYFPAADVYEREMVDLLGMDVRGLPQGSRYPLPDDWPKNVYPLRKDCDLSVLDRKEAPK